MNSRIRRLAPLIAAAAVLLLLVAGPGTRLGLWNFRTGFVLLRWGAYLGILAAGLGLVSLLWRAPGARPGTAVLAIVLGATAALVPYRWMQRAQQLPPIHDITTDVERPPEFQAVLPLRAGAANPADYGGPEIAAQQQQAYPDVVPLVLNVPTDEAFRRALQAAQGMGWEIVAADSSAGRSAGRTRYGSPARRGTTRSPCCAISHATPNDVASSNFHGSCPINPSRIHAPDSRTSPAVFHVR